MAQLTKDALLGASDLREKEIELDSLDGATVKVRGLGAAFSNEAQSEALEMKTVGRDQIAKVNTAKLEAIQVLHGLVDPKLDSLAEAEQFMENCGPAARAVVEAIDELSGLDKEAIADAKARFRSGETDEDGGEGRNGSPAGSSEPTLPPRTGA